MVLFQYWMEADRQQHITSQVSSSLTGLQAGREALPTQLEEVNSEQKENTWICRTQVDTNTEQLRLL